MRRVENLDYRSRKNDERFESCLCQEAPLLGTHCQHSIPGASIHLSAAEPLYGTATELDHMEVLTAANVMNATGGNSEGIEGMLERSPKAVQA